MWNAVGEKHNLALYLYNIHDVHAVPRTTNPQTSGRDWFIAGIVVHTFIFTYILHIIHYDIRMHVV